MSRRLLSLKYNISSSNLEGGEEGGSVESGRRTSSFAFVRFLKLPLKRFTSD